PESVRAASDFGRMEPSIKDHESTPKYHPNGPREAPGKPPESPAKAPSRRRHRSTRPQLLTPGELDGRTGAAKVFDQLVAAIQADLPTFGDLLRADIEERQRAAQSEDTAEEDWNDE